MYWQARDYDVLVRAGHDTRRCNEVLCSCGCGTPRDARLCAVLVCQAQVCNGAMAGMWGRLRALQFTVSRV